MNSRANHAQTHRPRRENRYWYSFQAPNNNKIKEETQPVAKESANIAEFQQPHQFGFDPQNIKIIVKKRQSSASLKQYIGVKSNSKTSDFSSARGSF